MMNHFSTQPGSWFRHIGFIGLVLLLLGICALLPSRITLADDKVNGDAIVTLVGNPNFTVAPDSVITYTLHVKNHGTGTVDYVRLKLPYDRMQLTLLNAHFDDPMDYIVSIGDKEIEVFFDAVRKDTSRSATLAMRVAPALPTDSVITMAGTYIWEDRYGNYDIHNRTNAVPVLVAEQNQSTHYVWTLVDPVEAEQGTRFNFFSDRFVPGERVFPWLRSPDGSERRIGDERQRVDTDGRLHVRISSTHLPPATYQLILIGEDSKFEGIATFTVTPVSPQAGGED